MAESVLIVGDKREGRGTRQARRLRRSGRVPAVLYGHKEENLALSLDATELEKAIRQGVHVVNLQAGGKTETALLREVQWDHLGKEILHVDLARVAADERIRVTVPIELRGTAAGIAQGGMLDQPLHTLEVECLAVRIPASIRVSVAELQIDSAIHVRDLVVPPDVTVIADPDAVVVHVTQKQIEPEIVAAAPTAEGGEPEVITRKLETEEAAE
jgi:large subunit ribosomal protein L25